MSLKEVKKLNEKASKLIYEIDKKERQVNRIESFQVKAPVDVRLYSTDKGGLDIRLSEETKQLMLKILKARIESKKYRLTKELEKLMEV